MPWAVPKTATTALSNATLPYLISIAEQGIGTRAVAAAKSGDAKARAWLAGYLIGEPGSRGELLHSLAVEFVAGSEPIKLDAAKRRNDEAFDSLMNPHFSLDK